ncbi:MAG: translation initiation factor eIF-1A [Thermoplasmataceae archaeon]|jgi:translation initiation factor 1A
MSDDTGNNNYDSESETARVILPNRRKGEMFGIVEKLSGASRLTVMCEDGYTRSSRIPGKMKKRMWIREKDLVIVKPWEFQKEKADVEYRYTQTQANYLSRSKLLPEIIDIFKKSY